MGFGVWSARISELADSRFSKPGLHKIGQFRNFADLTPVLAYPPSGRKPWKAIGPICRPSEFRERRCKIKESGKCENLAN